MSSNRSRRIDVQLEANFRSAAQACAAESGQTKHTPSKNSQNGTEPVFLPHFTEKFVNPKFRPYTTRASRAITSRFSSTWTASGCE